MRLLKVSEIFPKIIRIQVCTHNMMCRLAWSRDSVTGLHRITADPYAKCPKKRSVRETQQKMLWIDT